MNNRKLYVKAALVINKLISDNVVDCTLAVKPSKCLELSALKLTTMELELVLKTGKFEVKFPQTRAIRLSDLIESPS